MSCMLKKNTRGSSISIVPFIFQRLCDDLYQCLILIFSVIYLDSWGMGIYRVGPPSGYLKSFILSFLFILLFFFLVYIYSSLFSLSLGGPFSSGAPGHCPPMPPSCYATGTVNCTPKHVLFAISKLSTLFLKNECMHLIRNSPRNSKMALKL